MTKLFTSLALIVSLMFGASVAASDQDYKRLKPREEVTGGHCPSASPKSVEFEVGPDSETNVKNLIKAFHELDHDHGPKTLRSSVVNFVKHLYMARSVRDLQRMLHWKSFVDPNLTEHGKNILFIAAFTHFTETALAVTAPVVAWASGASPGTVAAVTAAGVAIAAPGGIEILCWAGYGLYAIPQARPGIKKMRLATISLAQMAYQEFNLSQVVARFGQWHSGNEILFQNESRGLEGHFAIDQGGIHLTFNTTDPEVTWLESASVEGDNLEQDFQNIKVVLDANTADALKQLLKYHQGKKDALPFYTKSLLQGPADEKFYVLQPGAIRPSGRWQWNPCEQWLRK